MLALVLALGATPLAVYAEENTPAETTPTAWDVSCSKDATALDENYTSEVTLSLPSAEEELSSDVVFVLDTSDCVNDVMTQVSNLVTQLKTAQENTKADIKVGAVIFKGSAYTMFDGKLINAASAIEELEKLSTNAHTEEDVLKYFGLNNDSNFIYKGSNLHAGLRAAQKLLDSDTTVKNGRKYLVSITDGMTYYWNDEQDNVYGVYSADSEHNGSNFPFLLFYAWCEAHNISTEKSNLYGLPNDFEGWDSYLKNARAMKENDNGAYNVNVREAKDKLSKNFDSVRYSTIEELNNHDIPYIPADKKTQHAHGIDYSVMACLDTYQEMVTAGYQCYTLNPDYGTNTFPGLFTSKLNEMANKKVIDFNSIQNDILYAVGAGSKVEDKMGSDFDLVPGTFQLTVGGKALTCIQNGNTYSFGDDVKPDRFVIIYNEVDDSFTWTINENVSNFAPVQLSYKVKLTNPSTTAGTYEVTTNEYARLTPKDSNGVLRQTVEFDIPKVSYTVSERSLSYDANGGEGAIDSATGAAGESVTVAENVFTRNNYIFTGWNTQADGMGTAYKPGDSFTLTDEDTVLYAQWNKLVTVSFDLCGHGGANISSQTFVSGNKASEPTAPQEDGWVFGGWYTEKGCQYRFSFDSAVTSDITLYAKWDRVTTVVSAPVATPTPSPAPAATPSPAPAAAATKTATVKNAAIPQTSDALPMEGLLALLAVGAVGFGAAGWLRKKHH